MAVIRSRCSVWILLVALSLGLASCDRPREANFPPPGAASPEFSPSPETDALFEVSVDLPEPVPATQPWNIAYALKTQKDPYWQRVKSAAIATGENLGVNIRIIASDVPQTAEFVEDQIQAIAEEIEAGELDGLILGPADSLRPIPVVEKAATLGIPVITMDTPLESDSILTFVGLDNFAAGKAMGEWVVQKLGNSGNVAILEGSPHHDNARERQSGFLAGLGTGKIDIVATQSAHWDREEAREIVREWLAVYPKVDAIIAANDEMALGAIAAMAESDRQDILVTGFDGSQNGLNALHAGKLAATIDQIPEHQARITIELMIRHLEGQEALPPTVLLDNTRLITRDRFAR